MIVKSNMTIQEANDAHWNAVWKKVAYHSDLNYIRVIK